MPSFEYDARYLEAGLEVLENYLHSKEIYWPIGASAPSGDPDLPRLTIGGLLLCLARAHANPGSPAQHELVYRWETRLEAIQSQWRVAWEHKVALEFQARLNLWRDFLEEYRQNPEGNSDRYAYEVQRRVMMDLLASESSEIPPTSNDLLTALDRLLDAILLRGEFVWDHNLASGFPPEKYWYLYGKLRT